MYATNYKQMMRFYNTDVQNHTNIEHNNTFKSTSNPFISH
jgi:hypothetical protein